MDIQIFALYATLVLDALGLIIDVVRFIRECRK